MNLIISFIAGVLTVLAPCVLPMLPIILSGNVEINESNTRIKRIILLQIILGMILSIFIFSVFLKTLTLSWNLPDRFWINLSAGIILIYGLNMLFGQKLNTVFKRFGMVSLGNKLQKLSKAKKGASSRFLLGASMGPVFSSCSPAYAIIVATILPVKPLMATSYLLAYCLGLGLVLYFVGLGGQQVLKRMGGLLDERGIFKRIIAILLILTALSMYLGWDHKLSRSIIDSRYIDVLTKLENKFFIKD